MAILIAEAVLPFLNKLLEIHIHLNFIEDAFPGPIRYHHGNHRYSFIRQLSRRYFIRL